MARLMNSSGNFSGGDFYWWQDFSHSGDISSGDFNWWCGKHNSTLAMLYEQDFTECSLNVKPGQNKNMNLTYYQIQQP